MPFEDRWLPIRERLAFLFCCYALTLAMDIAGLHRSISRKSGSNTAIGRNMPVYDRLCPGGVSAQRPQNNNSGTLYAHPALRLRQELSLGIRAICKCAV